GVRTTRRARISRSRDISRRALNGFVMPLPQLLFANGSGPAWNCTGRSPLSRGPLHSPSVQQLVANDERPGLVCHQRLNDVASQRASNRTKHRNLGSQRVSERVECAREEEQETQQRVQ